LNGADPREIVCTGGWEILIRALAQPLDRHGIAQHAAGGAAVSSDEDRVLVIAHDATLAGGVASDLASVGISVGHARDGIEALHRLAAQRPTAVVLDLDLALVSGYRVLQVLTMSEETRDVPVVVLSGQSKHEAWETLRDLPARGLVAIVEKPVAASDIAEKVRTLLAS
jgi:two-component system, OmpR family, response regulator MprA